MSGLVIRCALLHFSPSSDLYSLSVFYSISIAETVGDCDMKEIHHFRVSIQLVFILCTLRISLYTRDSLFAIGVSHLNTRILMWKHVDQEFKMSFSYTAILRIPWNILFLINIIFHLITSILNTSIEKVIVELLWQRAPTCHTSLNYRFVRRCTKLIVFLISIFTPFIFYYLY